jgi:hypothetical protein
MSTQQQAQQTLAQLKAKLAGATSRGIALATERRQLSYAAFTGDEAARDRLDKLNAQSAVVDIEAENAKSAVEEGKRRLAVAEYDDRFSRRVRSGLSPLAPCRN